MTNLSVLPSRSSFVAVLNEASQYTDNSSSSFGKESKRPAFSHASNEKISSSQEDINLLLSMQNVELIKTVQKLKQNTKQLELENLIFMHFLKDNDPSLIEEMQTLIDTEQSKADRVSISTKRLTFSRQSQVRRESLFPGISVSNSFVAPISIDREGPRINITQKTDLILREIDHIHLVTQKNNKKCYVQRHQLKAELEEMNLRETELEETTNTFENVFILGTLDKYAQKNPAEKFIRFNEELLKKSRLMVDKIRLRASSLKVQYAKTCAQLKTKEEIGKNLEEVDFEQLQIENKHLIDKIDKRNLLLMELKRMNGRANLLLSQNKKQLLKKLENKQTIEDTIKEYKNKTVKIDEDSDVAKLELDKTKDEYDAVKQKTESYEVPSVLEYVKMKAELDNLKKKLKITERRNQLKDLALRSSLREIKRITGLSIPRLSLFKEPTAESSGESLFEFTFARKKKSQMAARQEKISARRMSYKPPK